MYTPSQIADHLDAIAYCYGQLDDRCDACTWLTHCIDKYQITPRDPACEDFEVNAWRAHAFSNAAKSVRAVDVSPTTWRSVRGVGEKIDAVIQEFIKTGTSKKFQSLEKRVPPLTIQEFQRLPKVGVVKAKAIWLKYKVANLVSLKALVDAGKVDEEYIIDGFKKFAKQKSDRIPRYTVVDAVDAVLKDLRANPYVVKAEAGGSYRRCCDTIRDIDLLVAIESDAVFDKFLSVLGERYSLVGAEGKDVKRYIPIMIGDTERTLDLNITVAKSWGTFLNYLTGSRDFNIGMRKLCLRKGYTLNQHCMTHISSGKEKYFATEEDLFKFLEYPYVPPELRESETDVGKDFSHVITDHDIQADLHIHTTWTDGTLEISTTDWSKFNRRIGISDHSRWTFGIKPVDVDAYIADIKSAQLLAGIEVDINTEGNLDYDLDTLRKFDYLILAIHRSPEQSIVARFLSALHYVKNIGKPIILAHPTCRRIGHHDVPEDNWTDLFTYCAKNKIVLEINSQKDRLDLPSDLVKIASSLGCMFIISSDCHIDKIDQSWGLIVARKARLTSQQIVNSLGTFDSWFNSKEK